MNTKMIKIISVLSAAIIGTAAFMPVANADTSAKTVQTTETTVLRTLLESVKGRVEIPEEYSEFSSNSRSDGKHTVYSFAWRTEDGNKGINVQCCDNGIITSYSSYGDKISYEPTMSGIDINEAKKIAEDYVSKINTDYPYVITVQDSKQGSLYNSSYEFDILVSINGVALNNSSSRISVNREDGAVTSFYVWYNPDVKVDFNSADEFISEADAEKAYSEKIGMKLVYRSYSDNGEKKIYPVYVQNGSYDSNINAITGEVEKIENYAYYKNSFGGAMDIMEAATDDAGLTEQEIAEINNINGLIQKDAMEKKIRENKTLSVPKTVKLNWVRLRKDMYNDSYTYYMHMSDDKTSISVTADAKTGEISNYSSYSDKDNTNKKLKYRNDKAFKALAGAKADEYQYDEEAKQYVRYVNGVQVEDDSVIIISDGNKVIDYSISYSKEEFPSVSDAMSEEDAEKAMFEQVEYKAVCLESYKDDETHIVPVYVIDSVSINPFTGKIVDYKNEEITGNKERTEYTDISGHYAEKYIKELQYYGVGFDSEEFKPDEKIMQKDLLTLLKAVYSDGETMVVNSKEQAENTYIFVINQDIISADERDDESCVTREKAAVYMIRAMGGEEYASYNDIYVSPFADVTENKGYIALLSAMGVVSGDENNNFNPNHEITRAEFAVMLYKYLNR